MKKLLYLVIGIALVVTCFPAVTNAAASTDASLPPPTENIDTAPIAPLVVDASEYIQTPQLLVTKVNAAIKESAHVKIINLSCLGQDNSRIIENEGIMRSPTSPVVFSIEKMESLSNTFSGDFLNVSGAPGITIGLSAAKTRSYSITFSQTFGCEGMSANLAWGTSSAKTLMYVGTYLVPTYHNKKKVKRAYPHMRPEYKRKQYEVFMTVPGYIYHQKQGTVITKRAYSVDVYQTFVYE